MKAKTHDLLTADRLRRLKQAMDGPLDFRMASPSTNGPNRDSRGQFVRGCRPGPGNPHVARVAQWRSVLSECVSREDIEVVINALVQAAKVGERWAICELLDRCLGKPLQSMTVESEVRHVRHIILSDGRGGEVTLGEDTPALPPPIEGQATPRPTVRPTD